MRNARRQQKYLVNRPRHPRSIAAQLNSPMKNTLLFSALIAGVALTGCNKSTKTSTAANDPYTPATTADQAAANAQATADTMARDTRNAADRAADNVRSGINSAGNAIS